MPRTTYPTIATSIYTPPPIQLKDSMNRPGSPHIPDQQSEGACTGFALASVINRINQ